MDATGQELVGPYLLLERLGEGVSGQVFKARHERLGHLVALKVIRPERLTDPVAVARFQREVQTAASLSHPNVVRSFDAAQAGATSYLAMEYVPGLSLGRRVKTGGRLPIPEACEIISQAALGLQYIHDQGMVHRDIKPSNLAIVPGSDRAVGQVKILDLGLARLCELPGEGQPRQQMLTQLGAAMGTTDYMSPEQGRDSRSVDARSDLYSLGCTLYFALAGQPPFLGGTHLEKLMHHQLDEPEPIEKLRPEVPPALAAIVRKLMAKEPARRYPRAAAVAADLARFCPSATVAPVAIAIAPLQAQAVEAPEFDVGDAAARIRVPQQRLGGNRLWGSLVLALVMVSLLLVAVLRFLLF